MSDDVIRPEIWMHMLKAMEKCPDDIVTDAGVLAPPGCSDEEFCANLEYLDEHGLSDSGIVRGIGGKWSWSGSRITAHGISCLRDNTCLVPGSGAVTVKLDAGMIKALLRLQIDRSDAPEEQKKAVAVAIDGMSEEALTTVTRGLVKQGLRSTRDLMHWLRPYIS